jgi:hypothetical protein
LCSASADWQAMRRFATRVDLKLGRIFLAGSIAISCALPLQAQEMALRLTPEQAYRVSARALLTGEADVARDMSRALLQRDPEDSRALLQMATALVMLGDHALARDTARYLYFNSTDVSERRGAARIAGAASAVLGQRGREKIWLRRAAQLSETAAQKGAVSRAYRNSRRADPWQRRFSFSLTPSNNLNGGSSSELLIVDGVPWVGNLSGDAQALSGLRLRAGVDLKYRLKPTARSMTALGFRSDITRNFLSADAQDLAPALRNSDLNYTLSEVSISQTRPLGRDAGSGTGALLTWGAALGQTWYGGDELASYQRLSLGLSQARASGARLSASATVESQTALSNGSSDTLSWKLGARYGRPVGNGDRITLSLGASLVDSDNINSAWRGVDLGLSYQIAAPLAGAQLSLSLGLDYRDYDEFNAGLFMVPGGRQDQGVRAGITAVLPQIQYMGFAPVLSLDLARRRSNVSRYESRDLGLGLSFRSAF